MIMTESTKTITSYFMEQILECTGTPLSTYNINMKYYPSMSLYVGYNKEISSYQPISTHINMGKQLKRVSMITDIYDLSMVEKIEIANFIRTY